jgi:hypothetical protein
LHPYLGHHELCCEMAEQHGISANPTIDIETPEPIEIEEVSEDDGAVEFDDTDPCGVPSMINDMQQMLLVVSMWSIEETKYTKHLLTDIESFKFEGTVFASKLDAINQNPEMTVNDVLAFEYGTLVDTFDEMHTVVKSLEDCKKRRLTPTNSME